MQEFVEQTEFREIPNVIGHRSDFARERFEIFHRSSGDASRGGLMHRVDHHPGIIEGEDAICLVAMSKKAARESLSDDQRNDRVPGKSCRPVGVRGSGGGQVDGGNFLAPTIRLALEINQRDDRLLCS